MNKDFSWSLVIFIFAFIVGIILTFMFRDAENINKFRKGYDFDESISGLENEIKDNE